MEIAVYFLFIELFIIGYMGNEFYNELHTGNEFHFVLTFRHYLKFMMTFLVSVV
jgi:hypothetical protein